MPCSEEKDRPARARAAHQLGPASLEVWRLEGWRLGYLCTRTPALAKHPQTPEGAPAINAAIVEITRGLFGNEHPVIDALSDELPSQRSDRDTLAPFYSLTLRQACSKRL